MSQRRGRLRDRILRERGRARFIAGVFTLPLLVIPAAVFYFVIEALREQDGLPAAAVGVSIALIFLFVARWTFRFISSRLTRPRAQVMWLRRFRAEGRGAFQASHVIDRLARYGLSAITLQDRDVRESLEQRLNRLAPVFWLLFIPVTLGVIGAFAGSQDDASVAVAEMVENFMKTQDTSSIGGATSAFFGSIFVVLIGGIAFYMVLAFVLLSVALLATYGIFSITLLAGPIRRFLSRNRDDFPKLPKLLKRIARGKRPRGALVVRVSDEHWREAVRSALQVVDAVIIDVTDVTEAISWEIIEALRARSPNAIVFIARRDASIEPSLSPQARAAIRNALGKDIRDVSLVRYPARRKSSRSEVERFARELRESLYLAVDQSFRAAAA